MTLQNHNDEMEARLTAYAFGELEGEELAAMRAAEAADPLLALRVAELRAFGGELDAALKIEALPAPAVTSAAPTPNVAGIGKAEPMGGKLLRFPAWAWAAAGFAAAASVAVMVSLRETTLPSGERQLGDAVVAPVKAPETKQAMPVIRAPVEKDKGASAPSPAAVGNVMEKDVLGSDASVSFSFSAPGEETRSTDEVARSASQVFDTPTISRAPAAAALGLKKESAPVAFTAAPAPMAPPPAQGGMMVAGYAATPSRGNEAVSAGLRWSKPTSLVSALMPVSGLSNEVATAESYAGVRESEVVTVESSPLSTFSIDVDTASYANVRRFLGEGRMPPRDAVRIEELINYFPYRYTPPAADAAEPFAANLAVSSAPWAPSHRLVRVGIKGREFSPEARPPANLVFLIDVSGSMSSENKLPLVKSSLRRLLGQLRADDRVAIVTYAGASGLALPSTPAAQREEILASLDRLESGGSTNGGMGIHLAYDIAKANFRPEGANRVILCTDGDFNVGVTGREELLSLIQEKARSRVFLTVLGFGMGNLKDATLEMLADKGNGAYGYIDSDREARKIFVEQVQGTLATIAKDVKIQVEFNPARVASYRLIGYENRALAKEDFNNDKVDAGEVGAGHTVTALYEIVPVGAVAVDDDGDARPEVDALKYGPKKRPAAVRRAPAPAVLAGGEASGELLTVKIRYKAPDADVSRKLEFPLVDRGAEFATSDAEFKFAAAVAAWGMLLRESPHAGSATFADVLGWAEAGLVADPQGHRAEFVELVRRSGALSSGE